MSTNITTACNNKYNSGYNAGYSNSKSTFIKGGILSYMNWNQSNGGQSATLPPGTYSYGWSTESGTWVAGYLNIGGTDYWRLNTYSGLTSASGAGTITFTTGTACSCAMNTYIGYGAVWVMRIS
jgi:hypothetical protein